MNYLTTYSGRQFHFDAPEAGMIVIADIAHALSNLCHWNGHCTEFFSVAQHSVLVATICPPHLARWGLMHDAAEAYCGDISRMLKSMLPTYKQIETRILKVIIDKLGLDWPEPPELKQYDNLALTFEAKHFMHPTCALRTNSGAPMDLRNALPPIHPHFHRGWGPHESEAMFLDEFHRLFAQVESAV